MKTIRFLLQKILIVEVMLIILLFAHQLFQLEIPIFATIIHTGLKYLTPIAIISAILYIILSILSTKFIEIAFGIILGGIILFYFIKRV